jgi:hypothetical protein
MSVTLGSPSPFRIADPGADRDAKFEPMCTKAQAVWWRDTKIPIQAL